MYYINPQVEKLHRIFDQNSRGGYIRMDLNENPAGLPLDFIHKVLSKVDQEFVSKYPDHGEFTKVLADFIGAKPENICLTNGSAEAIRHIIEAYTRPGGKIVSVDPSYAMYKVYAEMYGRKHVGISYKDGFKASVKDLIAAIDDETDLVVVLNPNNPMGDVHTYEEMDEIINVAKKHEATVLIDEAYFYFYPNSFINYALENEHVLLTRTFSKLFSLAGARLGYCVGRPYEVSLVQKLCTPHNVNGFSMLLAQSIIEEDGMVDELVNIQLTGKKYLIDTLREKGYEVNGLEGNFIFIKPKTDAELLVNNLKNKKILVKSYDLSGVKHLRVTTGPKEIMEIFIEALEELDK